MQFPHVLKGECFMKTKTLKIILLFLLCISIFAGCSSDAEKSSFTAESIEIEEVLIEDEAVALADSPNAVPAVFENQYKPTASGIKEKKSDKTVIDYSNTSDGYVMAKYNVQTAKRIKAQLKGPSTTYTYNISPTKWEVFPISDGNGKYQLTILENVADKKYAVVSSVSFDASLKNEFVPFMSSNQYVNYDVAVNSVAKAKELTDGVTEPLKKVEKVYDFVVTTLSYNKQRAATVQSGYLPVLDSVLEEKKGICFDYAALMTGMLRSQGVPCKLVVGYAGTIYHAWISVWTEETGWIDGAIFFDGSSWHRMDPTFASSNNKSEAINSFISNDVNYTAKYFY